MESLILFGIISIPIIIISWRTLFNIQNHGLYRFISWESINWLFVSNYKYWFVDPVSVNQIFAWTFLLISGYLLVVGVMLMKKKGKQTKDRGRDTLYKFEQTTELIDTGIYKYIRHPIYSSLLFLTWGIFFKNTTLFLLLISMLSTVSLYFTAYYEEKECVKFFGEKYNGYIKRSKRFIPFII